MKLSEVKSNMHKQVKYDGSKYKLTHCVMSYNEFTHKFGYSVILLDKNKNSTIQVPIEKVEVIQNE